MPTPPPVRIAVDQPIATKAKQALMIGSQELRLFAYRQPYHLGHVDQREALLETLNTEFRRTTALPPKSVSGRLVVYLVVADGEPVLIPENDVLAWVLAYALAKGGRAAADRVSYRPDMLTTG